MGHRINYVVVDDSGMRIYYHHWRAQLIASDLFVGEKTFLKFVEECTSVPDLMPELWIEGCVVVDKRNKRLAFWPFSSTDDESVISYYLDQLSLKWQGWTITLLRNRMYDVEKMLGIDYVSKQEFPVPYTYSKDEILSDKVEKWSEATIIVKSGSELIATKIGHLMPEGIVSYGEEIIPILHKKDKYDLSDGSEQPYHVIIIDPYKKKLVVNFSCFGLWEYCCHLWKGYELIIGDFDYSKALQFSNIDLPVVGSTLEEIEDQFRQIVKSKESFDPFAFAEKLKEEDKTKDIKFNPNFFDDSHPGDYNDKK